MVWQEEACVQGSSSAALASEHSQSPAILWIFTQLLGNWVWFWGSMKASQWGLIDTGGSRWAYLLNLFHCWKTREVLFHPTALGLLSQTSSSPIAVIRHMHFLYTCRQEVAILTVRTGLWLWFQTNDSFLNTLLGSNLEF